MLTDSSTVLAPSPDHVGRQRAEGTNFRTEDTEQAELE